MNWKNALVASALVVTAGALAMPGCGGDDCTRADDKMAVEIFDDGALGRAYRLFKDADAQAQKMLAPQSQAEPEPPSAKQIRRRAPSVPICPRSRSAR